MFLLAIDSHQFHQNVSRVNGYAFTCFLISKQNKKYVRFLLLLRKFTKAEKSSKLQHNARNMRISV